MFKLKIKKPLPWLEMSGDQSAKTIANMKAGGSFAYAIADALKVADTSNTERLLKAFPDLIERFQPDDAFSSVEALVEKIGNTEAGLSFGEKDEHLKIRAIEDDVSSHQVRAALMGLFCVSGSDFPGAYFCQHVTVMQGPGENEYIAVIHHRRNV